MDIGAGSTSGARKMSEMADALVMDRTTLLRASNLFSATVS